MMLHYKLTDAEIGQALGSVQSGEAPKWLADLELNFTRAGADAAAAKAVRAVVRWLRGHVASTYPEEWGDVAEDIAAMLERIVGQGQR